METVQQSITHLLGLNILSDITENKEIKEVKNKENKIEMGQKNMFAKQPNNKSYYQKTIFIKNNNNITQEENVDKIIIDTKNYPCPCSDCGGTDMSAHCLLDARICELQNKFVNVKTYFNQKTKQYIITIPTSIKIVSKDKNKYKSNCKNRNNKKKNTVTFRIGDSNNNRKIVNL